MTSIDAKGRTSPVEAPGLDDTRGKSVLFCPVCGFEAPADEEWVTNGDESGALVCPNCDAEVAVR